MCIAGCGIVSWNGDENEYCSKQCRNNNAPPAGKSATDRKDFELKDDDESAHQSGSPIAHMEHSDMTSAATSDNTERHLTALEQGLTEAFPDSPNSTTELFDATGEYHTMGDSVAYANSVTRYTVTPKAVATSTKAYTVNRKPPIPYDEIKTCWISFFSGIAPDALFATIATREGEGHLPTKLDAFFAIEKCDDAKQISMHMNPESDYFPGITFPFDDVEDFTEEWLDRLPPNSIVGVTFGCPCVDFSLMRLLRNYKGEIPDPIKARPGLNGPQGRLTRLCFGIWDLILQRHQPVLISENVRLTHC